MKRLALMFVLQLFSQLAVAGSIADVFSEGIFGVKWGSPIEEVEKALPAGVAATQVGIATYTIQDGRTLFGVQREDSNSIRFSFDSNGEMNGVSIEFPLNAIDDYGVLFTKLNTVFGRGEDAPNSLGVQVVKWPEDQGIGISLMHLPGVLSIGDLLFTIEYRPELHGVSKEDLGF